MKFKLNSDFKPKGSQPKAIKKLVGGMKKNQAQTLLGVTGSGKTFTVANIIEKTQKPTLVIAHNKTLAAQLYNEFKEFFPDNRVEYFVSYYDYYQPESYLPVKDMYIEKDAQINPKIEQMRLSATTSLLKRRDVIIVASVSCIYSVGDPQSYKDIGFELTKNQSITRLELLKRLIKNQYERNDTELLSGRFRVKGDTIDIIPGYSNNIFRIEMFGSKIEKITELDKVTHNPVETYDKLYIFPAKHFVVPEEKIVQATRSISKELDKTLVNLEALKAHRLKKRTLYDIDLLHETGFCKGIENYSRHFDGRKPGQRPFCLLDYFPKDYMIVIDESHQTLPQIKAMYKGDLSRKKNLIEYGFRLPSALDNRPLKFEEFEKLMKKQKTIFVSATPGPYEHQHSGQIVEQIIRPTGLVDPKVTIHPIKGQIVHLKGKIDSTIKQGERVLVTTLTKKLAEELADYLAEQKIKTRYLHSEIDTIERTEIIRELRLGVFDVLVGINLLREGLDIPEVGFIGILDADKQGFLRDARSLIQIIGRAARNVNSSVVLYADKTTDSMKKAIDETNRRRNLQIEYNKKHNITPKTIVKPVREKKVEVKDIKHIPKSDIPNLIIELEADMRDAAEVLDFERAIFLRDKVNKLKQRIN